VDHNTCKWNLHRLKGLGAELTFDSNPTDTSYETESQSVSSSDEVETLRESGPLNITLVFVVLTGAAFLLPSSPVAQSMAVIGIVFVPGSFALQMLSSSKLSLLWRLTICVASGLLLALLIGAAIGSVLPAIGISHPLTRPIVLVTWFIVLIGVLIVATIRRVDPVGEAFQGVKRSHIFWAAVLALPPLGSLLGVEFLNANRGPTIAFTVAGIVVTLVVLSIALPTTQNGPPRIMLLASAVIAGAWQLPMRGGFLFGGDIDHEFAIARATVQQGIFPPNVHTVDPYSGMLSLTVWPAQLHALTGMSLRIILALLPSICLALVLVVVWIALREWTGERTSALIITTFLLGSTSMFREIPEVTRQCYGLLFFSLIVVAVVSPNVPTKVARSLVFLGAAGLAVTHYSSAYLACGALLVGWLFGFLYRQKGSERVLTTFVTFTIVAFTVLWEEFVAKSGSGISTLISTIRTRGLGLLPGKGSFLTRWLNAASLGHNVSAKVMLASDLKLKASVFGWMRVLSQATHVQIVSDPPPTNKGVSHLGSFITSIGTILNELVIVVAILSVLFCIVACRKNNRLSGMVGMATFALIICAVLRNSQTIAVSYSPSRIQLQMYLVLAITVGVAVYETKYRISENRMIRSLLWTLSCLVGAVLVATAMEVTSVLVPRSGPAVEYSDSGGQVESLPTHHDLLTAQWISRHGRRHLIQSDLYGRNSLAVYGFDDRRKYISAIDPVITDNRSWLFMTQTNITLNRAAGGNNAFHSTFNLPFRYFDSTRSVLYVSNFNAVFGPVPEG
jgi:hypothetical protein